VNTTPVGGVLIGCETVTVLVVEDVLAPLLSYAIAFTVYVPATTDNQVNEYGDVVSLLSSVVPL
jgi:hypothetical protein